MLAKGFGGAERSFVDTVLALAERGHQVQAICHNQFSKIELLQCKRYQISFKYCQDAAT